MDKDKNKKKSLKDYVKGKTLTGEIPNKIEFAPEVSVKKIEEEKSNTAVFAFGRFNPPTTGHEKLIQKVHSVAAEHGGQAHIIASHSQGTAKDPLPQDKKLHYLSKIAPKGVSVSGSSKEAPSFLHAAKKLHQAGHKHLVMVAGSDRVDDYKEKLEKYNGHPDHYNFKSIKVVSAGQRDPDSEGVEGMSGTKMRSLAREGKHKEFKAGLPKALHPHAEEIANHIRSVKEGLEQEIEEAVLTIAQRRKRAINLKRREPRIQRQKMIALKRFASDKALKRRSANLAKELVRTRFAGKRGANYRELSPSDKIAVDKQIQGKQKLVKALAARLYQRVRKREMQRIAKVRSGARAGIMNRKAGLVASSYETTLTQPLFESIFNKVICDKFSIDIKQLKALTEKSNKANISLFEVLEQFSQGRNSWSDSSKSTPEQLGFNNVNSLVAKFRKEIEEDAASHLRQAIEAQKQGQYAKANIHRKIASALSRGDKSTAKGLTQQLGNVKEGLKDPKDNPCWKGYKPVGVKMKNGKQVPNCVPEENKQLQESLLVDKPLGLGTFYTAKDLGMVTQGGFAFHPSVVEKMKELEDMEENFMDGKNPEDKGDMARHGLKNKTISQLKKIRSSENATSRQKQLAHWYINMHGKK